MKHFQAILFTLMLCFFSSTSFAANLNIETTEPAIARLLGDVKVLRDNKYMRATYGMALQKGDTIYTGRRGKVYIDFPDNSRVKLGSRARFKMSSWGKKDAIFTSSLKIFQGAFRYTAGLIRGFSARQTTVSTRTAVLGVRGTDFWGRVKNDTTFFLLIEGEVSLSPIDGEKVTYNQSLHAVNIAPKSISTPQLLSMDVITPLAMETEINH
ncbi:MAG: FecR family protein [Ghiorsea sp.]|nr:FecR family protein [Ghiorsea sp.]